MVRLRPRLRRRPKADPFYLGGPGGPEDFFYGGTRNADGTRTGDQQTIINALGASGVNGVYVEAVRTHGGDAYPDPTHNPFVNNDPAQGLNATVLNQWEGWIAALESRHVAVFFILYDDHADPFGGAIVGAAERAFIHGLIDRFENHTNIIWCVAGGPRRAGAEPRSWIAARSEQRMTMPTRSRSIRRPATTRWTSRMTRTSTNLRSSRTPPRRPG